MKMLHTNLQPYDLYRINRNTPSVSGLHEKPLLEDHLLLLGNH